MTISVISGMIAAHRLSKITQFQSSSFVGAPGSGLSSAGESLSFFCSTEQLPDIHVEMPNLGSIHF
jgi:hypothetical protein